VDLTTITVEDDKITTECEAAVLTPNNFTICMKDYMITENDITIGSITNTAMAHGFYNSMEIISNESMVTVMYITPTP